MLIFIEDTKKTKLGKRFRQYANYKCSYCESIIEKNKDNVKYGGIVSCGCIPKKLAELPNTINDLRVIKDLGMDFDTKKRMAIFECKCKNTFIAKVNSVKSKQKLSCGCIVKGHSTHKLSNHPLYRKWSGMITRTENKKEKSYKRYGGRNITVCNEWRNDFKSFYDWAINNGYQDGLTLDRINVNGNYEPSNCQWITMKENSIKDRHSTYLKKYKSIEIIKRYCNENITISKLSKEYNTYKEVISKILKTNNIQIKSRRLNVSKS